MALFTLSAHSEEILYSCTDNKGKAFSSSLNAKQKTIKFSTGTTYSIYRDDSEAFAGHVDLAIGREMIVFGKGNLLGYVIVELIPSESSKISEVPGKTKSAGRCQKNET